MKVLGIDCSTKITCVGVSEDGKILAETNIELGRAQSSELPRLTSEAIATAGLSLSEIDLIAVAIGPGYYTGIRTGVAYAAALAEALSLQVVPLSTMELFVHDLRHSDKFLAPVLRARSTGMYCALYSSDGDALTQEVEPAFRKTAQFIEVLNKYETAIIVGSDVEFYPELIALGRERVERRSGSGGHAALMGELYSKQAVAPESVRGCYLREPDIGPTTD